MSFETDLIKALDLDANIFDDCDETTIQHALADKLRAAAVYHLEHSAEEVAAGFRDTNSDWRDYLNHQAEPQTWGSETEFKALAEYLKFRARVSDETQPTFRPVDHYIPQQAGVDDDKAPIIHLTHNNNHWHQPNQGYHSTSPNHKCLYNGIAQQLFQAVHQERSLLSNTSTASNSTSSSAHTTRENSRANSPTSPRRSLMNNNVPVAELQKAILAEAGNFEKALRLLETQDRESNMPCMNGTATSSAPPKLSAEEQDRLLALRLQLEEIKLYNNRCSQ